MNRLYPVTGLIALVLPVVAGDVTGHALITKRLTKKALSPIVYNLRGAVAAPPAPAPGAPSRPPARVAPRSGHVPPPYGDDGKRGLEPVVQKGLTFVHIVRDEVERVR